jgi:thymidylate synthase
MENYHNLVRTVLKSGEMRKNRTSVPSLSIFNAQLEFDLSRGFPLLTTKKMSFKSIIAELCFFINGKRNLDYLHQYGCTIWDEWADANGDLGRIYGVQWRSWDGLYDQLAMVYHSLKYEPTSRRHLVSAWNVSDLDNVALPPCHFAFQFYVSNRQLTPQLSLKVYQRSADLFLGVPYNIASYAALIHFFALALNYDVGTLILDMADVHIYETHIDQCNELLRRDPNQYQLPTISITPPYDFVRAEIHPEQFQVHNYQSFPAIKAPVAV